MYGQPLPLVISLKKGGFPYHFYFCVKRSPILFFNPGQSPLPSCSFLRTFSISFHSSDQNTKYSDTVCRQKWTFIKMKFFSIFLGCYFTSEMPLRQQLLQLIQVWTIIWSPHIAFRAKRRLPDKGNISWRYMTHVTSGQLEKHWAKTWKAVGCI